MSLAMMNHQSAIQQNNLAVSLIAAGDFDAAINHLSNALKTYKQVVPDADEHDHPAATNCSLDECMAQSAAKAKSVSMDEEENVHYMYQQAIHIPLNIEFSYQSTIMVSVMIIFNLALANQLSAVGSNKSQSQLKKATKLYELAFNLQRDENFANNVFFSMATVNNIGLIYHKLNDRETGNKYFEHLLSTLMFLIDRGENGFCEIGGFLRNASNVMSVSWNAAAA